MPEHTIAENLQRLVAAKTAIGNAITAQGGTVGADDGLEDFATDIGTIPTGGGGGSSDDVRFVDYDGTVVQTYSAAEFANLSELPANPTHQGLTAQGWNWTLAEAKTHVAALGKLDIGQMYTTDDGKSRIYLTLDDTILHIILTLYLDAQTVVDVDWGDGSAHSDMSNTSATYVGTTHSYASAGNYCIVITVVSGTKITFSQNYEYKGVISGGGTLQTADNAPYSNSVYKVELGEKVAIGKWGFYSCRCLQSVTMPNTITELGAYAFALCASLSSIVVPYPVTSISERCFTNSYKLSIVSLGEKMKSLGSYAFSMISGLSRLTIPKPVTWISANCFQSCHTLEEIKTKATTVQTSICSGCAGLKTASIPNATTLGDSVFSSCYNLRSVELSNSLGSIPVSMFSSCYNLSSPNLPTNITQIGNYAYQYNYQLKSLEVPNTVTTIGDYAFGYCSVLQTVSMTNTVTTMGSRVFANCSALTSIELSKNLTSISTGLFYQCYSLYNVVIPASATSIGTYAFYQCTHLRSVKFEATAENVPSVAGSNAWNSVPISATMLIPINSYSAYTSKTNYPSYLTYTYLVYHTYEVGEALPSTSTDNYALTWYASIDDARYGTNPITQGNGNEVYAICTAIT